MYLCAYLTILCNTVSKQRYQYTLYHRIRYYLVHVSYNYSLQSSVATGPLVLYLTAFVTTFIVKLVAKKIGNLVGIIIYIIVMNINNASWQQNVYVQNTRDFCSMNTYIYNGKLVHIHDGVD